MLRTPALAVVAAAASPIDGEFAQNITVYHLNSVEAGAIPIDMDTGDAEGDLNFYLDQFLLPIECAEENKNFAAEFDCNNPERSGDLVVTKVEMEIDSRLTNYSACNYCDTGIDAISHQPCEIGKYNCVCQSHHYGQKATCDPLRVGVEPPPIQHFQKKTCSVALDDKCGAVQDNATACGACLRNNSKELQAAKCSGSDTQMYCPIADKCKATLDKYCGSVQTNASLCSSCQYQHQWQLRFAGCGQYDGYRYCPSTGCSEAPGDEWKCWHSNIGQKAQGLWYSHLGAGLCNETSSPGTCGWRVLSTSTVNETCMRSTISSTIEEADKSGCFQSCGPRNETSRCWIGCLFDTMLGPDAKHSAKEGDVTGMPLEDIIGGWTKAFLDEVEGGCPKVDAPVRFIV